MNYSILKKYNISNIQLSLGLFIASLPLPFAFINITFGLFVISCILSYKSLQFKSNMALWLQIIYFIICAISLIFTVDTQETLKYLSKGIFFLLLPFSFLFIPKFEKKERDQIFDISSYTMTLVSIIYLINAAINYFQTGNINHFFYHDLVTLDVNAIYVSLFVAMAFIHLLLKQRKKKFEYLLLLILFSFLILLSSKNVIIITCLATVFFGFRMIKFKPKKKIILPILLILLCTIPLSQKIYERFQLEFTNTTENTIIEDGVINVSIQNAWNQEKFSPNYYFNGTAFRVYQTRIFNEIMQEDERYFTGYGAAAVQNKITNKIIDDDLPEYYTELNFHNQYLQSFSTLGVLGFIILVLMHISNGIKSIQFKDSYFLFFTILTISIMFTESLFERQRGIVFFIIFFCIFHQLKCTKPKLSTNNSN